MGESDRGSTCVTIYLDLESKKRHGRWVDDGTKSRCNGWFMSELGALCEGTSLSLAVKDLRFPMSTERELLVEFTGWCRALAKSKCELHSRDEDIVLVAHNGFLWDFELLARMFVYAELEPPRFRICDSLVLMGRMTMWRIPLSLDDLLLSMKVQTDSIRYDGHSAVRDCWRLCYLLRAMNTSGDPDAVKEWVHTDSVGFHTFFCA